MLWLQSICILCNMIRGRQLFDGCLIIHFSARRQVALWCRPCPRNCISLPLTDLTSLLLKLHFLFPSLRCIAAGLCLHPCRRRAARNKPSGARGMAPVVLQGCEMQFRVQVRSKMQFWNEPRGRTIRGGRAEGWGCGNEKPGEMLERHGRAHTGDTSQKGDANERNRVRRYQDGEREVGLEERAVQLYAVVKREAGCRKIQFAEALLNAQTL